MAQTKKLLAGGQVLLETGVFARREVLLEQGRILALLPADAPAPEGVQRIDCSGKLVAPGFVDTHVHGARGRNFMEGSAQAVAAISDFMVRGATTSYLATTTSATLAGEEQALRGLLEAARHPAPGQAELLGIHLEGPFISAQNRGSHMEGNIRPAKRAEIECIAAAAQEALKLVTLAPEATGAMEAIDFFIERGVRVSIGHTAADFEQTQAALQRGAARGTHLFSGMPPIHHRQPGAVTALLLDPSAYLELTVDGNHIVPPMLALVLKAAGVQRCILITDGVDVRGLGDGTFQRWEGTTVTVRDGQARTLKGSLAGSMLCMCDAVRNMTRLVGVPVPDAIRMASENPARSIGVFDRKGSIAPGKDADFAVLHPGLSVYMTIGMGDILYRQEV